MTRIFIAGPMTGIEDYNYPAFDEAERKLDEFFGGVGSVAVYNPADNHNRKTDLPRDRYIRATISQLTGLAGLKHDHGDDVFVVVLPGWHESQGARLEVETARQFAIPTFPLECVFDAHWEDRCTIGPLGDSLTTWTNDCPEGGPTFWHAGRREDLAENLRRAAQRLRDVVNVDPWADRKEEVPVRASILQEAEKLIVGDRNNQYGPPGQDFLRTANILTSLGYGKGDDNEVLEGHDVAIIMIALKLSRLMWSERKRDSWVDVAGYAGCGAEVARAE